MKRSLALGVILVFLLAQGGAALSASHDETARQVASSQSEATDITLEEYMGILQIVQVEIGSETLPFVFDTGGGLTLLTPQLASTTGCQPYGRVTGFRMSGERIDVERCGELDLKVGDVPLRAEVTVFDLMSLLPDGWPELGGLVSLHTFQGQMLTLDLAANRLTVESKSSMARRIAGMKQMSARLSHQSGGSGLDVLLEVRAQRGSIWLELDTGNTGALLLAPHACKQLGLGWDVRGEESAQSIDSDVFEASSREITLDFVGLGPVRATAKQQEMIYDGVINADTIRKLLLTMNLGTGEVWGLVQEH